MKNNIIKTTKNTIFSFALGACPLLSADPQMAPTAFVAPPFAISQPTYAFGGSHPAGYVQSTPLMQPIPQQITPPAPQQQPRAPALPANQSSSRSPSSQASEGTQQRRLPDSCGFSTQEDIAYAVQYAGAPAEKKMKDLLKADYHLAQAHYYRNREKAGFMALERFELAHDRALGDIRELIHIKDDLDRQQKALDAHRSWIGGFQRARFKDTPAA